MEHFNSRLALVVSHGKYMAVLICWSKQKYLNKNYCVWHAGSPENEPFFVGSGVTTPKIAVRGDQNHKCGFQLGY